MSPKIKMSDIHDERDDDIIELSDEELKEILADNDFDDSEEYGEIHSFVFSNPDPYAKVKPRPDDPEGKEKQRTDGAYPLRSQRACQGGLCRSTRQVQRQEKAEDSYLLRSHRLYSRGCTVKESRTGMTEIMPAPRKLRITVLPAGGLCGPPFIITYSARFIKHSALLIKQKYHFVQS